MHIMADLGPPEKYDHSHRNDFRYACVPTGWVKNSSRICQRICGSFAFAFFFVFRLGQKENEFLLVTIKTDGSGTVIVKPDFNKGREPYRWVHHWPELCHSESLAHLTDQTNKRRSLMCQVCKHKAISLFGGSTGLWQEEKRRRFGASLWRMHPPSCNQMRKTGSRTFIKMWVHHCDFCCANGGTKEPFFILSCNGCLLSVCSYTLNTWTTWIASWGKILKWLVILNYERHIINQSINPSI